MAEIPAAPPEADPAAGWAPGPRRPRAGAGVVDVWLADLRRVGPGTLALLNGGERERAARFARERSGARWSAARSLLRELLGRYLEEDPRGLRLALGEHGKPALQGDPPRLFFNVSHSADVAVYAFGADGELGVDVEVARRPREEVALAARVLGREAAERLARLEPAAREQAFLREWVRHEATVKWLGSGLGAAAGRRSPAPWIAELEIGPAAAAAVAGARAPSALRRLRVAG